MGPPSTTIIEMSKAILREYGIDPETDISPYYLSFEEGVTKVVDGELDATFFVAGTPTATLMNAASINDMELVGRGSGDSRKGRGRKSVLHPLCHSGFPRRYL